MHRSFLSSLRRDRSGVAAIEFGMLALPFFAIVLFLIEIAIIFTAQVALENAVRQVSRDIRIGAAQDLQAGDLRSRICDHLVGLYDCDRLAVTLRAFESYADLAAHLAVGGSRTAVDPGASDSVMTLSTSYRWSVKTPLLHTWLADSSDGAREISAYTIFRNEPF